MSTALQIDFLAAGITDSNGNPLNGGKVYTYEAGTLTEKTCWTEADESVEATNPIILNARGQAAVYGDGNYKFVIKDSDDNTLITFDNMYYNVIASYNRVIKSISGNYTVTTDEDVIFVNASGGNVVVTLYTAVGHSGYEILVKKTDSSSNTVTIDGHGTETIDGSTSKVLSNQYEAVYLTSNGSNWFNIHSNYEMTGWPPTATPTADRIPIAGPSGNLSGWLENLRNTSFRDFTERIVSGWQSGSGGSGGSGTGYTDFGTIDLLHRILVEVDTSGSASADDLDEITGLSEGELAILVPKASGRVVTLKHATKNIYNPLAEDIELDGINRIVAVVRKGVKNIVLANPGNPSDFDDATAGNYIDGIWTLPNEVTVTATGPTKAASIYIPRAGTYRFVIYLSGAEWKTMDVSGWSAGDIAQLYLWQSASAIIYAAIYRDGSPTASTSKTGPQTAQYFAACAAIPIVNGGLYTDLPTDAIS